MQLLQGEREMTPRILSRAVQGAKVGALPRIVPGHDQPRGVRCHPGDSASGSDSRTSPISADTVAGHVAEATPLFPDRAPGPVRTHQIFGRAQHRPQRPFGDHPHTVPVLSDLDNPIPPQHPGPRGPRPLLEDPLELGLRPLQNRPRFGRRSSDGQPGQAREVERRRGLDPHITPTRRQLGQITRLTRHCNARACNVVARGPAEISARLSSTRVRTP